MRVVAAVYGRQPDFGVASDFATVSPFIVNNLHFRIGSWTNVFLAIDSEVGFSAHGVTVLDAQPGAPCAASEPEAARRPVA